MFDSSLDRLTGPQLAALITANHDELMEHETRVLVLACAWADLHDGDPDQPFSPLVERSCQWGGDGTPEVSEFCVFEFGTMQQTGYVGARSVIADALDLRHRLPRLWAQVKAGAVRAWQARKIAQATHDLSAAACAEVDVAISGYVTMLSWTRFQKILAAAIIDADPEAAAERTEKARTERGVWASDGDHGLKTLIAKAAAGDVVWFMATVNRIADILALQGDLDPVGARRSKAIGILAQPARALQLLIDHQHDPDHPAHATEPDRASEDGPDDDGAADAAAEPETDAAAEPGTDAVAEPGTDEAAQPGTDRAVDPEADAAAEPQGGRAAGPRTDQPAGSPADGVDEHGSLDLRPRVGGWLVSRPKVTLVFHLSDAAVRDGHGTVRPEHGTPETLAQLHAFLADTGCQVTVRPVVDPAATAPVDGYEIPARVRAAVRLRHPGEVFPYGSSTSAHQDLDHTIPYQAMSDGGPPGQTGVNTLGPLSRAAHRATTLGRWQRRQPDPGTFVWKSPNGWVHVLTNKGNLNLGTTTFARATWHAATTTAEAHQGAPA